MSRNREEIIAEGCRLKEKWEKHFLNPEFKVCLSDARTQNLDNIAGYFLGGVISGVEDAMPDIKWKKECLESKLTNPRNQVVVSQVTNYIETLPTMPLTEFNSKKCKGKDLTTKGFAMDQCMFGELLEDLTEELESDLTRAVEDTKFCEHIDAIVKCAKSQTNKCFSKKVQKEVDKLYMGMIAFAGTQRLAHFEYDPAYLAQCGNFKSVTKGVKKDWIETKTGANTCDMAEYYKNLGLGIVCEANVDKLYQDVNAMMVTAENNTEEFISKSCTVRAVIVNECQTHNTCYEKSRAAWLSAYQKNPIKVLFNFISQVLQDGFQWKKDCP